MTSSSGKEHFFTLLRQMIEIYKTEPGKSIAFQICWKRCVSFFFCLRADTVLVLVVTPDLCFMQPESDYGHNVMDVKRPYI